MKLLFCKNCYDVISLTTEVRKCKCGESKGFYTDDLNAVYIGENATPLGFANSSLFVAVVSQPEEGWGEDFKAFVIPKTCKTFVKLSEEDFNKRIK